MRDSIKGLWKAHGTLVDAWEVETPNDLKTDPGVRGLEKAIRLACEEIRAAIAAIEREHTDAFAAGSDYEATFVDDRVKEARAAAYEDALEEFESAGAGDGRAWTDADVVKRLDAIRALKDREP
ncbi:MAG: hypothetical protein ACF8XB_00905 [Planctomycetota bacterium JB042]